MVQFPNRHQVITVRAFQSIYTRLTRVRQVGASSGSTPWA